MPVNPSDYALVVGINDYPSFRSLKGAIRDATDMYDWLIDDVIGGGVPPLQCLTVFSSPNPIRPIHKDIDNALEQLVDLAEANGGGRRFYLYFSGHGLGSGSDTALCLAAWSEKHRFEALESPTYTQYLKDRGLFEELVLIMDCCRVKKVNAKGLPCTLGVATPALIAGATMQFTAHATQALQPAYEAVVAATVGADGLEVRGHFTRALLEALYGAAALPGGGVTSNGLKKYLEVETPLIAKESGHEQRPEVLDGLPSVPDRIFGAAKPIARATVNFTFPNRMGVVALETEDLSSTVLQAPAIDAAQWTGVKLPPGYYSLRDTTTNDTNMFRVRPTRGVTNVSF